MTSYWVVMCINCNICYKRRSSVEEIEFHQNEGALNRGYVSTENISGVKVIYNPAAGARDLPPTGLGDNDLVISNPAVLQVAMLDNNQLRPRQNHTVPDWNNTGHDSVQR